MINNLFSKQAEQTLLSVIINNSKNYYLTTDIITPDDIYNVKYALLYAKIGKMLNENKLVDFITISELKILDIGELSDILTFSPSLMPNVVMSAARTIKEYSIKRHTAQISEQMKSDIDNGIDIFDTVNKYQKELESLVNFSQIETIMPKQHGIILYDTYMNLCKNKDSFAKSGFRALDKYYGGFMPSEYSVIGARTSIGKSALAVTISNNVSKYGQKVAYITTEMSPFQILIRLASMNINIPLSEFRQYNENNITLADELFKYCSTLEKTNIIIENVRNSNEMTIYAKIKMLKEQHDVKIVFVDLADKIKCSDKKRSRHEEIKVISNKLFDASRHFDLHVSALVQLNRETEKDAYSSPSLHHLKESGDWEQDADVVILIDRPEQYGHETFKDKKTCINLARLKIAKSRQGATGYVEVGYNKETTLFYDIDETENANNEKPPQYSDHGFIEHDKKF